MHFTHIFFGHPDFPDDPTTVENARVYVFPEPVVSRSLVTVNVRDGRCVGQIGQLSDTKRLMTIAFSHPGIQTVGTTGVYIDRLVVVLRRSASWNDVAPALERAIRRLSSLS